MKKKPKVRKSRRAKELWNSIEKKERDEGRELKGSKKSKEKVEQKQKIKRRKEAKQKLKEPEEAKQRKKLEETEEDKQLKATKEAKQLKKMEIRVTHDEEKVAEQVIKRLGRRDDLYTFNGRLLQVEKDGIGRAVCRRVGPGRLREIVSAVCRFWKKGSHGTREFVAVPSRLASALLERAEWVGVQSLNFISSTAFVRDDGSLISGQGRDKNTGVLITREYGEDPRDIPVTRKAARSAVRELCELVSDFPFAGDEDRAAYLAAILTPFVLPSLRGPVPLFLIEGNEPGVGKGKLASLISLIATGDRAPIIPATRSEDELRKTLLSIAYAGQPVAVLDNVSGVLASSALDAVVTTGEVQARVLSTMDMRMARLSTTLVITANNLAVHKDTQRRVCYVRLVSELPDPETRADFKYSDILRHTEKEWQHYRRAALTILCAYHSGQAKRDVKLCQGWGSFEDWSAWIRAPLVWAGMPDPALSRHKLASVHVGDDYLRKQFVVGLSKLIPENEEWTAAQICKEMCEPAAGKKKRRKLVGEAQDAFFALVGGSAAKPKPPQAVGMALQKLRDTVASNGKKRLILKVKSKSGQNYWFVRQLRT